MSSLTGRWPVTAPSLDELPSEANTAVGAADGSEWRNRLLARFVYPLWTINFHCGGT
jgi:hypothetical protein